MRGASRVAFADARDRLTEVVADADVAATVGDELFAVVRLLDQEPGLRRALADYTSAPGARTGLVRDLLGDRANLLPGGLVRLVRPDEVRQSVADLVGPDCQLRHGSLFLVCFRSRNAGLMRPSAV